MSPEMIGLIGIIILIVLMIFFKVWVGFAMALVGFVGYMVFEGWDMAVFMSGMEPYTSVAAYTLSCIPLFILMGSVVAGTGISTDIYVAARQWIGFVRGGIAMATVAACGLFAAITGSSMATAVTMGKAAYPEMVKYEYDDKMAAGSIAAGGTIGILIPPSIAFITYGILTETPIGQLFIAGIIPGILEVVFYILTIYIICLIKPHYGPPGPKTTFKEKIISLPSVLPVVILFLVVIGGIYGGIFTPTEAGAIGAFGAIVIGLVQRRLKWGSFVFSLRETAKYRHDYPDDCFGEHIFPLHYFKRLTGCAERVCYRPRRTALCDPSGHHCGLPDLRLFLRYYGCAHSDYSDHIPYRYGPGL